MPDRFNGKDAEHECQARASVPLRRADEGHRRAILNGLPNCAKKEALKAAGTAFQVLCGDDSAPLDPRSPLLSRKLV